MKKICICAHPDDEALWFNGGIGYDEIYFVFIDRLDKLDIGPARRVILSKHPLAKKIKSFDLIESNYWKDKMKEKEYKDCYDVLVNKLKGIVDRDTEFWTHNLWGEYGHSDHILVHQAVLCVAEKFGLPMYCYNGPVPTEKQKNKIIYVKNDINWYHALRSLYKSNGAWTYDSRYEIEPVSQFFRVI